MSYTAPILPQENEEDEAIELSLIVKENGLKVRIPRYTDMRTNESVIIFINGVIKETLEILSENYLPRTYLFPDGYRVNSLNEVYYRVIDLHGNRENSVVKKFTISGTSKTTFTLETTTGAVANGIAVNQATVLIKKNGLPSNGEPILMTLYGPAVFSNQENTIWIITDQSGEAKATFSSLTPGTVKIRAIFNGSIKEKLTSFIS